MRLESAQGLKQQLLENVVEPFSVGASRVGKIGAAAVASAAAAGGLKDGRIVFGIGARPFATLGQIQRSVALGVARRQGETGSPSACNVLV